MPVPFAWSFSHALARNEDYQVSEDGSHWSRTVSPNIFQFAVEATPIPEPATLVLAGIGLGAFLGFHRHGRSECV